MDLFHLIFQNGVDGLGQNRIIFNNFLSLVTDDHFGILEFDQFRILLELLLQLISIFISSFHQAFDEVWQFGRDTGLNYDGNT